MENSTRNALKLDVNTDWNVVRFRDEPDEFISDGNDNIFCSAREIAKMSESWPDQPRQIDEKTAHAPALQPDLIPERLRGWVLDIAERMQIAPEIVVAPALVAFSCVVGKKIGICPKKHDDWMIIPNLWGGLVAPTGFLKAAAINEALLPMRRLRTTNDVDRYSRSVRHLAAKAKAVGFKEIIKSATKRGDVVTIDQLKTQIEELVRDAEHTRATIRPYDTVASKRGSVSKLITESPNGLLIIKGHLDNWLRRLSKKKNDDEREFFLSHSNSARAQASNSAQDGFRAPLAMFGELAPSALQKYLRKARLKSHDMSLLHRIQLLIYPDSYAPLPSVDKKPNYLARENVFEVFQRIDDVEHTKSDYVPAVRFSDEAQGIYDQWAYELKLRTKSAESENPLFANHIGKHYSLMPSLALLFSILERPENIHGWNCVSASAANLAIRWCAFLESHTKKAYSIYQNAQSIAVKEIATSIEEGWLAHGSSLKSICRRQEMWQPARELVRNAIETLEDFGWLRIEGSGSSKRIALHPKFQINHSPMRFPSLYGISRVRETN